MAAELNQPMLVSVDAGIPSGPRLRAFFERRAEVYMVNKGEVYRNHAAECLALARKALTDEEGDQLREIAKVWETLAAYEEADEYQSH